MIEWVEQWICIKFCIKLERLLPFPGNYSDDLEAHSYGWADAWQLHHDNAPTNTSSLMQSFFMKHQITQVTQPPYSPEVTPCDFWLFPKVTSPLKGKRFQTIDEIQGNMMGQLMAIRRTLWGPKAPALKGTEASLSCVQYFLYLVSSSINVSIFHITWLDTSWTNLVYW